MTDRENSENPPDEEMKCVYMGPPKSSNSFLERVKERFGKKDTSKKTYPESFADEGAPDADLSAADGTGGSAPEEKPEIEEVYMGPPMPEEEKEAEAGAAPETEIPESTEKQAEWDPGAMEGVYAGPQIPPMAPVYAGPEMMNGPRSAKERTGDKGPRMEALYAAPRRPDAGRMMLVYAGPEYFARRGNTQTPMAPVYAGPDFFANRGNEQTPAAPGSAAPAPSADRGDALPQEEDGRFIVCPLCGGRVPRGRFCTECGARLPQNEESGRMI